MKVGHLPSRRVRGAPAPFTIAGDALEPEPITVEFVVLSKDKPMTIEKDALCEDLRAWVRSPAIGLPQYSADPVEQRRVAECWQI